MVFTLSRAFKACTYWIFHNLDWVQSVWLKIKTASLEAINIEGGPTVEEMEWFRTGVFEKHRTHHSTASTYFTPRLLFAFAKETASRYREWRY